MTSKEPNNDTRAATETQPKGGAMTNALLVVASIVLALVAGEIMLRVFEPAYMPKEVAIDTKGFWQPADIPELIYENRPDATLTDTIKPEVMRQSEKDRGVVYPEKKGVYILNDLGMRGANLKAVKDKPRVLVLGDSVAFGLFLNESETYNAHLIGSLELQGIYADILNAAVVGYSTRMQSVAYRKKWTTLEEDLLVLVWCMNDVADDTSALLHVNWHELLLKHFPLFEPETRAALYRHSYIFRQIVKTYTTVGYNLYPEKFHFETHWDYHWILGTEMTGQGGDHWKRTKGFLKEMADEATKRGVKVVQVVVPLQVQVYRDSTYFYYDPEPALRLLKEAGRENGYEVLDLTPAFVRHAEEEPLFVDMTHVSAKGARIMAEETARYLAERNLLPKQAPQPLPPTPLDAPHDAPSPVVPVETQP